MLKRIRKYFITGLIVFLPLTLSIYLFVLLISIADGFLGKVIAPYFRREFGFYFKGLSILIAVYLVILTGFLATHFVPRRIYVYLENLFIKIPFFKQVYPAIKEMAMFLFSGDQLKSFKEVVLVQCPRTGLYAVGFLTNESSHRFCELTRQELCNVFIPSVPSPLTGFVFLVPKKDIIFTDVKIEDAIKFLVSGGVVNP